MIRSNTIHQNITLTILLPQKEIGEPLHNIPFMVGEILQAKSLKARYGDLEETAGRLHALDRCSRISATQHSGKDNNNFFFFVMLDRISEVFFYVIFMFGAKIQIF